MEHEKGTFRHESLQDSGSIGELLSAISDGLSKGELAFSDGEHDMALSPQGLLHLKVTASKEDGRNRVNIRVTWQDDPELKPGQAPLKVNQKSSKKKSGK